MTSPEVSDYFPPYKIWSVFDLTLSLRLLVRLNHWVCVTPSLTAWVFYPDYTCWHLVNNWCDQKPKNIIGWVSSLCWKQQQDREASSIPAVLLYLFLLLLLPCSFLQHSCCSAWVDAWKKGGSACFVQDKTVVCLHLCWQNNENFPSTFHFHNTGK